jgi:excisionase family DNA binding protein
MARLRDSQWIGLSEASRLLGVAPATLRRWSDDGRIRAFTTPGGHRRFARASLERLLPSERARRPTLAVAGVTGARIARRYRAKGRAAAKDLTWVLALSDEQRSLFRERGRTLAEGLLLYLDAEDAATAKHHLKITSVSAADYGRVAAAHGLSLSQTVEGFLRFRAPFLQELASLSRRRSFDATETTELLETAERGMDHLLIATMTGHSVASVEPARGAVRRRGAALESGR